MKKPFYFIATMVALISLGACQTSKTIHDDVYDAPSLVYQDNKNESGYDNYIKQAETEDNQIIIEDQVEEQNANQSFANNGTTVVNNYYGNAVNTGVNNGFCNVHYRNNCYFNHYNYNNPYRNYAYWGNPYRGWGNPYRGWGWNNNVNVAFGYGWGNPYGGWNNPYCFNGWNNPYNGGWGWNNGFSAWNNPYGGWNSPYYNGWNNGYGWNSPYYNGWNDPGFVSSNNNINGANNFNYGHRGGLSTGSRSNNNTTYPSTVRSISGNTPTTNGQRPVTAHTEQRGDQPNVIAKPVFSEASRHDNKIVGNYEASRQELSKGANIETNNNVSRPAETSRNPNMQNNTSSEVNTNRPTNQTSRNPIAKTPVAKPATNRFEARPRPIRTTTTTSRPGTSRTAPSSNGTSRTVPSNAGTTRTETPRASEPTRTTPSRTRPTRTQPSSSAPSRTQPTRTAPTRSTPTRTTPTRSTPTRTAPTRSTPTRTAPTRSTPTRTAPSRSTPTRTSPSRSSTPSRSGGSGSSSSRSGRSGR